MSDVQKALEAAASAAYEVLADGRSPGFNTRASVASRAAVLAFLRAMPDFEERPDPRGVMQLPHFPSAVVEAIEKETAP